MPVRLLLGPQRPVLNLGDAIAEAELPAGPVAVVAAGWQEAESDIDDVAEAARRDVINLRLYGRADEVFAAERHLGPRAERLEGVRLVVLAVHGQHHAAVLERPQVPLERSERLALRIPSEIVRR